jgi:hypothetical protein
MKVKELIKTLKGYPQGAEVVMSKDELGSKISSLDILTKGTYRPNSSHDSSHDDEFYYEGDMELEDGFVEAI